MLSSCTSCSLFKALFEARHVDEAHRHGINNEFRFHPFPWKFAIGLGTDETSTRELQRRGRAKRAQENYNEEG